MLKPHTYIDPVPGGCSLTSALEVDAHLTITRNSISSSVTFQVCTVHMLLAQSSTVEPDFDYYIHILGL